MSKDVYWYPPVEEWKFRTDSGMVEVELDEFINSHIEDEFNIGTDSHVYGRHAKFATSLIAYRWGVGGYVATFTQKTPDMGHMRPRLINEAMRSLTLAYYLDTRIPKDTVINIHLDVNGNSKHKSNRCKEEVVGMIMGQGARFRPLWKPDAWGSSKMADKYT